MYSDPEQDSFAQDPAVVDLVAHVLGPDVRFHGSKPNFKWSDGGEAVRWHQDIQAWPHNRSIFAAQTAEETSGI